ncbi:MAG: hypothetical protein IPK16_09435 [Anaerolineales bacterium]|nr:hypothetical protein [Anaerolineales bacterium]
MISQAEFMAAPAETVAAFAPASIVYAAAGTRRAAVLAGEPAEGDGYAEWSRGQMMRACRVIFDHGVQHVFTLLAGPGQFQEVGAYRGHLIDWIAQGVAGDTALRDFQAHGWNVRLLCGDEIPLLSDARKRLREQSRSGAPTLWLQVIPEAETPWQWAFTAIKRSGAESRREAVRALYGEEIAPISLLPGFGKPVISADLLPPLLAGSVQCYWSQQPGYSLTAHQLRLVLYDYAFHRSTWRADKTGRAEQVLAHADAWRDGPILGLGRRLGPFWYPEHGRPFSGSSLEEQ